MSKRVYIVEEDCMGCGRCETTCPEVFKIDEDNDISKVILPEGSPADAIQAAIGHCQGLGYVNGVAEEGDARSARVVCYCPGNANPGAAG